jgi:tRNA(Ile)-lysidine synthase
VIPAPDLVDRFRRDLASLIVPRETVGVAVSGGPDSIALLLLAAAARRGQVEAATVDHALREGSAAEAEQVARLCEALGVPHRILTARWDEKPQSAIQERARGARYALLGQWVEERGLAALATAHHVEDQAETLLMRLARGAGVRGLAAMRASAVVPETGLPLLRPLLGWRRAELEAICVEAGVEPAADPSNADERFERVRIRRALGEADWLDPQAIVRSAAHLGEADAALDWAAAQVWTADVSEGPDQIVFRTDGLPPEIQRRLVERALALLKAEGTNVHLRGRELDPLLETLRSGGRATLRGVLCTGGEEWRFVPAPNRTRRVTNSR